MKVFILASLSLLAMGQLAHAESAWDFDSCMEGTERQFTCQLGHKTMAVNLETSFSTLEFKSAGSEDKIFGIYVKLDDNNKLYISCDDASKLQRVRLISGARSRKVSCR